MTLAILGLVGAVLPFIIYLLKRKLTNVDDPKLQAEKRRDEIHANLDARDSNAASVALNDRLRALRENRPKQ
jgi:hypothetical protein